MTFGHPWVLLFLLLPAAAIVCGEGAGHHGGLVHSVQLAWSGDARVAIERDDEGFWTLSAGAVP